MGIEGDSHRGVALLIFAPLGVYQLLADRGRSIGTRVGALANAAAAASALLH